MQGPAPQLFLRVLRHKVPRALSGFHQFEAAHDTVVYSAVKIEQQLVDIEYGRRLQADFLVPWGLLRISQDRATSFALVPQV